jgi:inorganic pyrophosphatase
MPSASENKKVAIRVAKEKLFKLELERDLRVPSPNYHLGTILHDPVMCRLVVFPWNYGRIPGSAIELRDGELYLIG